MPRVTGDANSTSALARQATLSAETTDNEASVREEGVRAFFEALCEGNALVVTVLLQQGVSISQRNEVPVTACKFKLASM